MYAPYLAILATVLPQVIAWGAAGHEIVATIAQIHLHPATREKLCSILPPEAKCHLAPIAAWADQVRMRYPGSGPMHYINGKNDHPADHCEFGEHGWVDEDVNVLTAITNMTGQIMQGKGDIPLRFLTHFIGDMHQPLHLTGRDKGGNGAMFLFEGRHRNLHSVWDSGIITKNIRELSNYTSPLPSKQIESNLLGAIFDPYVRWIVWEGIREWYKSDLESWIACPESGDPFPHSTNSAIPPSNQWVNALKSYTSSALSILPFSFSTFLADSLPLQAVDGFRDQQLSLHPSKVAARSNLQAGAPGGAGAGFPVCPYTWAKPLHAINCEYAWPSEYTGHPPLIELDTDKYLGRIGRDHVVEKVLAMGGIRLAHVLNKVYGGQEGVLLGY